MTHPNQKQFQIAELIGIDISQDTKEVAAARLLDEVSDAIGERPPEPSTKDQQRFAKSLGIDVSKLSKRVASAVIQNELQKINRERLKELQLKAGDRVIRTDRLVYGGMVHEIEKEFIVSSISLSGRIYFKGGRGEGGWPTQVRKVQS